MAAYLIAEIDVTDQARFDEYRSKVPATLERHGGRYVVRGGDAKALEGGPEPKRLVVLEFPDMATLERWHDSADYRPLRALRQQSASSRLIAVEGV